MSYGGHRGAGERVLEGRHVIGLFLAVILLSGLFFTLGYVMGLHQSEASADALPAKPELRNSSKPEAVSKRANKTVPAEPPTETGVPANPEWEFYHAGEKGKAEDRLKPAPSASSPQLQQSAPVLVKSSPASRSAGDRKSTRLNSSHSQISYAVFCLKKKKKITAIVSPGHDELSGRQARADNYVLVPAETGAVHTHALRRSAPWECLKD